MRSASPIAWAAAASSALVAIADEDRLDLGAELPEVGDTHRRPAGEDLLAVGVRGGRQDRDARTRSARRGQQSGVELDHRGEEFTGADERHGSGHGESLSEALARPGADAATLREHDPPPALDPRRHRHRLRRRVPRRDDRQRRAQAHRPGAARLAGRRARGPGLHRQRLPRRPGRPAHPRRRPLRPLRPAARLRASV